MGIGDSVKNGLRTAGKPSSGESRLTRLPGGGKVAGALGRGSDDSKRVTAAQKHTSKPITSLPDPSSFAPPPKHRDYYGEEAATASIPQRTISPSVASSASRPGPPVPQRATPLRSNAAARTEQPEEPAGPYRIDTTGINTTNLPPPPQHRDKRIVDGSRAYPAPRVASSAPSATSRAVPQPPGRASPATSANGLAPKPSLPPRVPPRTAVAGGLASAGHDVPDSPPPPYVESERPGPVSNARPAVGELQERFARIRAREEALETQSVEDRAGSAVAAPPPVPAGTKPR